MAGPLKRVAKEFPLAILSKAADHQIHQNVAKLEAPFHAVFMATQAQAYKPRMQAFEYMLWRPTHDRKPCCTFPLPSATIC